MANTIAVLRDFLVNHSNQPIVADDLDGSSDLLEEGILDSLSLMVLVDFLSEHYSVEFEADEIIPRNFKSLETIATLVDEKLEGRVDRMPETLRVAFVGSHDLRELLLESGGADQEHGLAANLSASTHVEFSQLPPQGWTSMLGTLRSNGSTDPFDVLLTSATAELDDPGREPREALIELARFAGERHRVHVVVLNASTLLSGPDTAGHISRDAEPLDLRIRRLNLAIMEASKATGLSVLDADRLVAETRFPIKVAGGSRLRTGDLRSAADRPLIDPRRARVCRSPRHGSSRPVHRTDRRALRRTVAEVGRRRCGDRRRAV